MGGWWKLINAFLASANPKIGSSSSGFANLNKESYFGLPSQKSQDTAIAIDAIEKTDPVSLSVCLSPGCLADGSKRALEKLRALAPAHVHVEGGPCKSFCGSGPVVVEDSRTGPNNKMRTVPYKRISAEDRILKLLYPGGEESKSTLQIVKGYNLGLSGDEAFGNKNYEEAIKCYEAAVDCAFRAATDLQNKREQFEHKTRAESGRKRNDEHSHQRKTPEGLKWMVRARRREALAKIEMGDVDGAMLAIQASCNMSRNTSSQSIIVLARVYQCKNNAPGELTALQNLFHLRVDESKLNFAEKNARRLAEIRLQKLKFQLKKS
mmetsp:Transcript_21919/g.28383  ORF Transcript_21919/g.28383 Transcript_21919/m.28383 type:complete len:322 (-) Transcript_21919:730-1695(-)